MRVGAKQSLAQAEGESARLPREPPHSLSHPGNATLSGPNALCSTPAQSLRQPQDTGASWVSVDFKGASLCPTDHSHNLATDFYGFL